MNNFGIIKVDIGKGVRTLISCKFSEKYVTEAVKRLNAIGKENVKYYVTVNMNAK